MLIDAREIWLKNGKKLVLRSPIETDAKALLEMLKTVNSESYKNMNHVKGAWDDFPIEKERDILNVFANSGSRFMISSFADNGRIVGNIGVFGIEESPLLKHSARIGMGVLDEYKNLGLGTQLMRTAMFEATAKGFHRLELTVRTFNTLGIALYEKVGFKQVGRLRDVAFIDGEYHDEFSYDLILASDRG